MTLLTVVGARPQFIKAGVVSSALGRAGIDEYFLHTGQHFDEQMSSRIFEELGMRGPDLDLGIHGGSHGEMTGRMLVELDRIIAELGPSAVLTYGDTNSTLAAALAGSKAKLPVIHVEAGLRSFNRSMPEEVNRVVTDHVSALLLCPTTTAVTNLESEGVVDAVHLVGDVMYDLALSVAPVIGPDRLEHLGLDLQPGTYAVATIHRAENTDDPARLRSILDYVLDHSDRVVLPLHPRTAEACRTHGIDLDGCTVTSPLGYLDMAAIVANSALVLTDSGGLQKEAYFHRVPCVTLRDETEWVETIDAGWNRLWTADWPNERCEITEFGDGHAADVVARLIGELVTVKEPS